MPEADVGQILRRLESLEDSSRERGDQLGALQGDVREIRALLGSYATTKAVYDSLAPIQDGMRELQQSGALLAREVTTIAHSFEDLTNQVKKLLAAHEESLQAKAREDQAKAQREKEVAERREQEAQEKHAAELKAIREEADAKVKAIQDEQKERKFMNRLRKSWLPFASLFLAVLIAAFTFGEKLRGVWHWLTSR